MFNLEDKEEILGLLNQVLPPHADALVSARAKLAAGQADFSEPERAGIIWVLDGVSYSGVQTNVLAQMERVAQLKAGLGTDSKTDTATPKKRDRHKKTAPAAETQEPPA